MQSTSSSTFGGSLRQEMSPRHEVESSLLSTEYLTQSRYPSNYQPAATRSPVPLQNITIAHCFHENWRISDQDDVSGPQHCSQATQAIMQPARQQLECAEYPRKLIRNTHSSSSSNATQCAEHRAGSGGLGPALDARNSCQ